jgi:DNA polymerase III subunit alpha
MSWVPLHVHSQYSILDSTASVSDLASKAGEFGCSSLALTDQGNMYGAVEFYKACIGQKIKPILGCELFVAPFSRFDKKRVHGVAAGYPVVLLVKNKTGYKNLCRLSSLAHLEGFYYTPRIDRELLKENAEGLICLSGPLTGKIASLVLQQKEEELLKEVQWFRDCFKENYYFELQRHRMTPESIRADKMDAEPWLQQKHIDWVQNQEKVIAALKELSQKYSIPCVATNDIHYIEREDWKAHEILMNIQSGEPCEIWEKDSNGNPKARTLNPKREVLFSHEYYFKSPAEMMELFADIPDAVKETVEIASQCSFDFDFKSKYYPVFVPPHLESQLLDNLQREKEAEKFLRDLCEQGIQKRYLPHHLEKVKEKYPNKEPINVVRDRLQYELEIITSKGMCDYLLIVYDFIAWAKKQGIPVGPGRGSGAGSIILYLIGITDIEPLRFHLFFERFINPERISYPDIDVDICMERRQEVIDYTVGKYGKEKVAQIITFGTMKAKMAIKDVGRVLSVPLAKVNAIAKLIPEDPNMTLEKALEIDPDLKGQYEADPEVQTLINIALRLEGSVRNTGIHAAGLIIGANPLMDNIPICLSKDSDIAVTQFSMKPVEAVGMLKIDFLGLKTLTSVQKAADAIQESTGKVIDWVNLPLEDSTTFELLNQGKTQGIFQLESGGMQELAKQLHIDKFEEIIAVGALYRPGPMEMIPSFINRKHGRESIDIDHPLMEDILAETYGIMVYQEQVMQIASRLANYTLGEGDVLRRAMGKKDKEEMARQREKFKNGAFKNNIDEATSMRIFDKIEKFASYGFNKSHAAAYGYLTYVTAYLKANYPREWMAALMTSDRDDVTKVAKMIRESQSVGIEILPPDINESSKEFMATAKGIRFAMSGIKGVGEGVVDSVLKERKQNGLFKSLYDFIKRIDTKKVGKKVIEHLIEAGCFDFTEWSRPALIESVDAMFMAAARDQKEASKGIIDFLSLMDKDKDSQFESPPAVQRQISKQQMLKREYELLGFYLRGHPLDDYRHLFPRLSCCPFNDFDKLGKNGVCRAAFIVETVSVKISAKSQKKFAILTISDGGDRYELPVWSDLYEEKNHLLIENQLLYAVLQIEYENGEVKLQCKWLDDLTKVDENMLKACDMAYDRAKTQAKAAEMKERFHGSGKSSASTAKEEKKKETDMKKNARLKIMIDADQARLSHVVELKHIFRSNPGRIPVCIEFHSNSGRLGSLQIVEEWGVQFNDEIEQKLNKIISIKNCKLDVK